MGNNQARQRSTDTQTTLHRHPGNAPPAPRQCSTDTQAMLNQKQSKAISSMTYFRGDCFLYGQKTAKSSENKLNKTKTVKNIQKVSKHD